MWLWLKDRWKVVLGSILTLLGVLSVYARLRSQKEILEKANESHEKDNKINDKALRDITAGFEKIEKEVSRESNNSKVSHEKKEKDLAIEKAEFEKETVESESLAKDLAKSLGAKYVKNKE